MTRIESLRDQDPHIHLDRLNVDGHATTLLLVRHAYTDAVGHRLVGRTPGVALSDRGRAQLPWLRGALARQTIAAVYSSPLERARETAEAIPRAADTPTVVDDGLIEVEFGDWTGLTFDELAGREDWRRFNATRSAADVPRGERAPDVQARIVSTLDRLRRAHRGATIAAVSHADVIRAAILYYVGAPLDMVHRLEVRPASISGVWLEDDGARILFVNWSERCAVPEPPR